VATWLQVVLVAIAVLSLSGSWLAWWIKLRPARLYHGFSGVTPFERSWDWLSADAYEPRARPWLWVVRILTALWLLTFFPAFFAVVAHYAAA